MLQDNFHSYIYKVVVQHAHCYYSCGGSVNLKFSFYISLRHVGQDAASKTAAVINTGRYAQCLADKVGTRALAHLLAAQNPSHTQSK